MIGKLWNDNSGGVITSELVLVASVTVGILLAGLTSLRSGLLGEYAAVESAIRSQSVSHVLESPDNTIEDSPQAFLQVFDPHLLED